MHICKESDVFKNPDQKICISRYEKTTHSVKLHAHEFIEISFITEGKSRHTINGRSFSAERGDLVILNSNMAHAHTSDGSFSFYYLALRKDYILSILSAEADLAPFFFPFLFDEPDINDDMSSPILHFRGNELIEVEHIFASLHEEYNQRNTAFGVMLDVIFRSLLVKILRNIQSADDKAWISDVYKAFPKIVEYINSNLSENLSIADIAKRSLYSPSYFSRLFKEYYGQTVKEYITAKRLERAEALLKTTAMTIDEIISSVGYTNKNQFYKIFKAQVGKTPAKYRIENTIDKNREDKRS